MVVEYALGWPRYGLLPGRSVAAVGGRAVVVGCEERTFTLVCWRLDVGV